MCSKIKITGIVVAGARNQVAKNMNLLNDTLLKRFRELGPQDIKDPVVVAKFFTSWSNWTWYATSYDEITGQFFGVVCGNHMELGYFSMQDLKGLRGPMGLSVERDLYWKEKRLSEISKPKLDLTL